MELVAIASGHQRLTTNQRVMSRFDAVKVAVVSPLENCRRLPQSAPHTYPASPHRDAQRTRRKQAKRPTCRSYHTANESKGFAPRAGLLRHVIEHRNLCRSRAPRRMAAISRHPAHTHRKKAARAKASPRGRGSYAKPLSTAICVGAAPRGEWRPLHDIRAVRKPHEQRLRPGAGLLQRVSRARSAQCRRLRHISCASLALSGRSTMPFSVTM